MFEGQCFSQVLCSTISLVAKTAKWVTDVLEIAEVPKNSHVGIICLPQKCGGINRPTKMHLKQWTQHGHQTGRAGSHCAAGKWWQSCQHDDMVG